MEWTATLTHQPDGSGVVLVKSDDGTRSNSIVVSKGADWKALAETEAGKLDPKPPEVHTFSTV